jgi:exoribonuclease R
MDDHERVAGQVDAAVRDLAEAVLLSGREGDVFDGVIVDEDDRGAVMQITDPAVLTRIRASKVDPGSPVRAKLVSADPATRRVEFERVG